MKRLYLIAGLSGVQLTGPVMANPSYTDIRREVVQTKDLDLNSNIGVGILDRRIQRVASSLCRSIFSTDTLGLQKLIKCREQARASATERRLSLITRAEDRNGATNTLKR